MQPTSAAFDEIVARIRALAMDEWRGNNLNVYPAPAEIAEAQARLMQRLWAAVFAATDPAGTPRLPRDPIHNALAALNKPGRANE